ncbi:MAG: GIY-YIG nuclease family protein [Clostridium sp.]
MKNLQCLVEESGIYRIYNTINNKSYIGQSKNIKKRILYHHVYDFNNPNNSCYENKFYQAIRKYGLDNFEVEILVLCDQKELNQNEIELIDKYNSFKDGYNSTVGGQSLSEKIHCFETELKRQATRKVTRALQDENHPRARLSNDEVVKIRQRYINGETCENIQKDYPNYALGSFKKIIFGLSYKGVGNIPPQEERRRTNGKFTADQIRYVRSKCQTEKTSHAKVAEEFGVSQATITGIVSRRTYKNIE